MFAEISSFSQSFRKPIVTVISMPYVMTLVSGNADRNECFENQKRSAPSNFKDRK